ncbi:MAG: hypothetical protein IJQ73_15210, partial [Kiritimatiellae bacterium]|nr:hypothetical protein [Kiritimatiellia bacterium]
MDKYSIETVSGPVRPWARRIAVAATAFSIAISVSAQTSWRTAAGSVAAPAQAAPQVVASSSAQGDQTLTYSFPAPTWRRGADGVADVSVSGLDNFGAVGEPELPRLPVRIALPEGRAVASVEVVSSAPALVARGLVLRHAERPIPLSRAPTGAATPRNRAVYASREAYPATPGSAWSTARKNGVDFCELTLCPISYIPASGEVYFLSDITVTVRLAAGASAGASG